MSGTVLCFATGYPFTLPVDGDLVLVVMTMVLRGEVALMFGILGILGPLGMTLLAKGRISNCGAD